MMYKPISSIINKGMGIDYHMRNLKKQFFTTISSGVVNDIIHIVVLVLVIFVFDNVCCLMMLLILFFCWRSLGEKSRVDSRQKESGGFWGNITSTCQYWSWWQGLSSPNLTYVPFWCVWFVLHKIPCLFNLIVKGVKALNFVSFHLYNFLYLSCF